MREVEMFCAYIFHSSIVSAAFQAGDNHRSCFRWMTHSSSNAADGGAHDDDIVEVFSSADFARKVWLRFV